MKNKILISCREQEPINSGVSNESYNNCLMIDCLIGTDNRDKDLGPYIYFEGNILINSTLEIDYIQLLDYRTSNNIFIDCIIKITRTGSDFLRGLVEDVGIDARNHNNLFVNCKSKLDGDTEKEMTV